MAEGDLAVGFGVVIPAAEIVETASRSSGPGGQNVNKRSSRVTLRWNVETSAALTDAQHRRLRQRLGARLTRAGELLVHAQAFRTRPRNRELARERLAELVADALRTQRTRVPTRKSKRAKARAIEDKRRRGRLKRERRPRPDDD